MEPTNAFVGRKDKPSAMEVSAALAGSAETWNHLMRWLSDEHGVSVQDWKSYSPKYGWTVKMMLKKRTILHASPCNGYFQVMFILGDKAFEAARQTKFSKTVTEVVSKAPKYPEGTGIRLRVKSDRDLPPIRKLTEIKLTH